MFRKILITGGAGFIGSNLTSHFLSQGKKVIIFDNLSRAGSEKNLSWLSSQKGGLEVIIDDIRNFKVLKKAVLKADCIIHLAAQTAVTTSFASPKEDFEINTKGTLNVLKATRLQPKKIPVFFASTNKVYGSLPGCQIIKNSTRYEFSNLKLGINETQSLDFNSPYSYSKGLADQYVRDYHQTYGLQTVVFRQSCIYGPRQFGIEDQGWVAHFVISALTGKPITIYGNGLTVRDLLYIDDLVTLFDKALDKAEMVAGEAFNIGGGEKNTISVWEEFSLLLKKINGRFPNIDHKEERPDDQKVYISDISKAKKVFDWEPKVGVEKGIEKLYFWVKDNLELFKV